MNYELFGKFNFIRLRHSNYIKLFLLCTDIFEWIIFDNTQ